MTRHVIWRKTAAFSVGFIALTSSCVALGVAASPYPERPVRLLVGFAPGGGSDTVARIIAPKLEEAFGQRWVVDNRGGAAGNIATEIAARANPDGYTALIGFSATLTVNPMLYKVPFDVARDLQPVVNLASGQYVFVLHPSVPAKSLKEFVDLARAKPGSLKYGSGGIGSGPHLAAELFKVTAKVDLLHVPYKGGGPTVVALLAGEVKVSFASLPSSIAHVKSGRLRALGVTGPRRAAAAPDIPMIAESGFPGYQMTSWYGLLVPAKTPARIVGILHETARKALELADVREQFARQGLEIAAEGPKEFTARIQAETALWAKVIRATNIRAE